MKQLEERRDDSHIKRLMSTFGDRLFKNKEREKA
jgi:hypothetical protein